MNLAWISLLALVLAVLLSCVTSLNVGVVSLVLAWLVGVVLGGMTLGEIVNGFPSQLFLTLAGVTLFFASAQCNGTLERVAHRAVRLCRGNQGVIPVMFFVAALALATIGPGNIATAALLIPIAMAVAARAGVPAFLMAIMVGNGANAGSLSPFAPTGVIVAGLMGRIGLAGHEWQTYANNAMAHALVAFGGYALFGGLQLFGRQSQASGEDEVLQPLELRHWITLGAIGVLIGAVVFLNAPVGMVALACTVALSLAGIVDEKEAIRRMPWGVIIMVCGVTVLIALLEKTKGMDLFSDLLARTASKDTVTGVIAGLTGLVSVYSSTSGVVLPAFLPTIPGLVERLGGGDPLAIASSMNVGGHLVDVSPLSTLGALCLAGLPAGTDSRPLFNKLLAWGLAMCPVGALICWIWFGR